MRPPRPAFCHEQAGGYASDGRGSILDIHPKTLHDLPLFIGSRELVQKPRNIFENMIE